MEAIVYYYPQGHETHQEAGHPECPERVETIRQSLEAAGYWQRGNQAAPLTGIESTLEKVHSPLYLRALQQACQAGAAIDGDTYTTPASWQLSLNAAGGAIAVAEAVWRGEARTGFALTRPPGHHATRHGGMGFCLLNNVAAAAEYLLGAAGARRLAIVDLDLHHGNGTQDIFWERGDVFYASLHQFPLYPGTGRVEDCGTGEGEGKTANFPLPPGSGDQAFLTITKEVLLPLLGRHKAEMILVSYGFDAHWRDPLGYLQLSAAGYRALIERLRAWAEAHCQGRIALFLEGGYDLDAAAACSQSVVSALLDLPWEDTLGPSPHPEGKSWQAVYQRARELWQV